MPKKHVSVFLMSKFSNSNESSKTMNPKRKRKLLLVLALVVGVGIAIGLAMYAMRQNINLFYTPSQLANGAAPEGQRIQAGGLVVQGSVKTRP
jgi:cytochrome c-type biogenesis protein CcmE